ncbi:MAG: dihydroorotate dehydrogenase-like protein, partial [Acidobacteriota bacterium]
EPDIDVEQLELRRTLRLSTSSELLMRLHWIAILWGRVEGDLALTGGVHTAVDAIKATMVGASAVQLVSCLLAHGPERLGAMRDEIATWLEKNEYLSLDQARGSMSLLRCPDPHALERANYARILQTWR